MYIMICMYVYIYICTYHSFMLFHDHFLILTAFDYRKIRHQKKREDLTISLGRCATPLPKPRLGVQRLVHRLV